MVRFEQVAMSDYHVHPDYSIDAKGTLEQYCQEAFNSGLSEICFTSHYDADPVHIEQEGLMVIDGRKEKVSDDTVAHYLNHIDRVREEYGSIGLLVRSGLEFGYFHGCQKPLADLQEKFPLDFRLGSVHVIDDLCVCCKDLAPRLFAKYTLPQLADRYFDQLVQCASTGLFDCLGHMDVYRRYGAEYYGPEIDTIHRGRIEKVFQAMRKYNVGFELNTSAIRHGHREYYPAMEIVNLAREAGVPLLRLGSDAHCPQQLALDFEAAATVAYELFPYVDE